jgi:hypothetical protein
MIDIKQLMLEDQIAAEAWLDFYIEQGDADTRNEALNHEVNIIPGWNKFYKKDGTWFCHATVPDVEEFELYTFLDGEWSGFEY